MGLFDILSSEDKYDNEEEMETCVTCGTRIPKRKYEENGGVCFNCIV